MKPIKFKEVNGEFGTKEDDKSNMPAYYKKGVAITCWKLSFLERVKIIVIGKTWLCVTGLKGHIPPIALTINKKDLYPLIK